MNVPQVFMKLDNISFIREGWNDFITYLQQFIGDYFDAIGSQKKRKKFSFPIKR